MGKPLFQFLTQDEKTMIIDQVYRILEEIGVKVYSEKARALYEEAGCTVEGELVKIPREIVQAAVKSAPSTLPIYNRKGEQVMLLGAGNSYFGTGPTCPNFQDVRTGERHPSTKEDAVQCSIITDGLENVDYQMSLVMIGDQTPELADIHEIDAMVRNSIKPICGWTFHPENLQVMIDMCAAVAGGLDKLQEKPFLMVYCEPTTPLFHTKEAIESLILLAEKRIPAVYSTGMLVGTASPVTIAGSLTVGTAECLSGLVLHQHIAPGAPYIGSTLGSPMDMSTMQSSFGAPEGSIVSTGSAEIFRELGLPSYGRAGAGDAKIVDAQASAEATLQILISIACAGDLVHDLGFLDFGLTGSPLYVTLEDDLIGYCRRYMRGIEVDEDRLGFDSIKEVGPGGSFLDSDVTLDYYEEDLWVPKLFERQSYDRWVQSGMKDMTQRAQERMVYLLDNHRCEPLPDEVCAELDRLVAKAEADFAKRQGTE